MESRQGGSTAILMLHFPSWEGACTGADGGLEALAGSRQGAMTLSMKLIYCRIIATVSGTSAVCVLLLTVDLRICEWGNNHHLEDVKLMHVTTHFQNCAYPEVSCV